MENDQGNSKETLEANIYVHSFLANNGEYNKSPHFLPENQEKVRKILERLCNKKPAPNKRLIDFGCGTGFIINLTKDLFDEIHGVDITDDMMRQVDTSSGNIVLHNSIAEKTPFEDCYFDFATAYSFMDHLVDYKKFLIEAFRVLKPGGGFYSDLNPNREFFTSITKASNSHENIPPLVKREIQGAINNGELYAANFGLDAKQLEMAEPIKTKNKGFDGQEVLNTALEVGFSEVHLEYEWFLGQGKVIHEQSQSDSDVIEQFLLEVMPLSSNLYKYLRFFFIK